MPYARVKDIRMYYEERGTGVPFVLMHGATGSIDGPDLTRSGGWAELMPLFSERYRAIHVEHRGHSRTNNPAGTLSYETIAEDVCRFIEGLDVGPVHIGGVSDGAITALHIGMTRPDLARSLSCVGANYYNDPLVEEANGFADVGAIERDHPDYPEQYAAVHDRNKEPGYWRELFRQLAENLAVNPAYTPEDLQKIPTPTLLMSGENDLWANVDQMVSMRRNIPDSEMLIINNAEHTIQHSHPGIVGPVVLDFLERNPGEGER